MGTHLPTYSPAQFSAFLRLFSLLPAIWAHMDTHATEYRIHILPLSVLVFMALEDIEACLTRFVSLKVSASKSMGRSPIEISPKSFWTKTEEVMNRPMSKKASPMELKKRNGFFVNRVLK